MILTRLKEVEKLVAQLKASNPDIVVGFTSGCWDLQHFFHLNTFLRCRAHCDFLIVAADGDDLVMANKGVAPGSPWWQRCWGIANCVPVDAVVVQHTEKDYLYICEHVDVVFKNSDVIYGEPVRHGSAKLVIIEDVEEVTSTSELKAKIVRLEKERTKLRAKTQKAKPKKKPKAKKKPKKKKKR